MKSSVAALLITIGYFAAQFAVAFSVIRRIMQHHAYTAIAP